VSDQRLPSQDSVTTGNRQRSGWSGVTALFPYWLILLYFTAGSLIVQDRSAARGTPAFVMGLLVICLMIGFRYHVGGDWIPYIHIFERAQYQDFFELGRQGDVGYQALNWSAQKLDLPFWSVNLVTGVIFSWGLARFARSTPNPWTALVVAIPYLVIVVSMGYTRQGTALGVLMCAIADFHKRGSLTRVAAYIFVAALFHKTAVACLPLFFFGARGSKPVNFALLVVFSFALYQFFLSDSLDVLERNYIESKYSSSGALIRILLSSIPAALFLMMKRRFEFSPDEERVWTNYSYAALFMLFLFAISPSSTAVDRIALYLLPLEVAILTALPSIFKHRNLVKVGVIAFSFAVQFTWLNFGTHAALWLPYQTYLSEER
jgi:hypothetical protein